MNLSRVAYWGATVVMVAVAVWLRATKYSDSELPVWVYPVLGVLVIACIVWDVRRARRAQGVDRSATDR